MREMCQQLDGDKDRDTTPMSVNEVLRVVVRLDAGLFLIDPASICWEIVEAFPPCELPMESIINNNVCSLLAHDNNKDCTV